MKSSGVADRPKGRRNVYGANFSVILALVLASAALSGSWSTGVNGAEPGESTPAWHDTGITLPPDASFCIAANKANTVLLNTGSADAPVYNEEYNWVTKSHTVISNPPFPSCAPQDWPFYGQFSTLYSPVDGTSQLYEQDPSTGNRWLRASSDGGVTWEERGREFSGRIMSLAISDVDSRAIYILVLDQTSSQQPSSGESNAYTIYFSSDGGVTWDKRASLPSAVNEPADSTFYFKVIRGVDTPINDVAVSSFGPTLGASVDTFLSTDGARTFRLVGTGLFRGLELFHNQEGLLRTYRECPDPLHNLVCTLSLSTDEGRSWQPLPLPDIDGWGLQFAIPHNAPWNIFMNADDSSSHALRLYYSPDGGHNWHAFDDYTDPKITPYLPLSVLGTAGGHLYVLDLPDSAGELTAPVQPTAPSDPSNPSAARINYFPATGHNISPVFESYWQQHGRLAQQGYPITEAFREVSDVDGKAYTVQYFERSAFELHPENNPPYNVLLSLLGTQAYRQRYGTAGAPNQHPSADHPLYFPQTGHTIGGLFRTYWEQHGGLAQQGYPISDEFQEKSSVDGKTRTVQYFERAVFELHPENTGTPFVVLLSQLGRFQVTSKYRISP